MSLKKTFPFCGKAPCRENSIFRGWFIGVLLIACLADLHPRRNIRADKSPVWPLCY